MEGEDGVRDVRIHGKETGAKARILSDKRVRSRSSP